MIQIHKAENMARRNRRLTGAVAVALTILLFAALGFAQEEGPSLRVVNTGGLPGDISRDPAGIGLMADLDPAEHPRLFADCCSLSVTDGGDVRCYEPDMVIGCDVSPLTVTIERGASLNFTTTQPADGGERCDAAVVDADGAVTCLDRPVVIDYQNRSVSFIGMPPLSPGDVLLLFVEGAPPFPGTQKNTGRNYECG